MNLGHGRAGHLPDYSFITYRYMPAWDNYLQCLKDNPREYYNAFAQMVYAMRYLRGDIGSFELDTYDEDIVGAHKDRIMEILTNRQLDACEDWKAFGCELSGGEIPDFDEECYVSEYQGAGKEDKAETFLGRFMVAAMAQKSMVTNMIYKSGNMLAGFSVDYDKHGMRGIKDFRVLVEAAERDKP
jgi:hypothetical protein